MFSSLLKRESILLMLLWFMFTITSHFAMDPDVAWLELQKISKIFLMTFITIFLLTIKGNLDIFSGLLHYPLVFMD